MIAWHLEKQGFKLARWWTSRKVSGKGMGRSFITLVFVVETVELPLKHGIEIRLAA